MKKCKACGSSFASTVDSDDLCITCGRALRRLNGYAVPVVHARWEDHHCTNCGAACPTCKAPNGFVMRIETPYCPHCGAKMDAE